MEVKHGSSSKVVSLICIQIRFFDSSFSSNRIFSFCREESRRAEMIASSEENFVRPIPANGEGPLAQLEKTAVEFLERVKFSEMERLSTGTLRPKDLDESKRGPLGDAEAKLSDALIAICESEAMRRSQMSLRGGEAVRPIDVPGPIGEFEKAVAEIVRAEQERVRETQDAELKIVRPKDAKLRGPLGEAEIQAIEKFQRLADEERERLRNIQKVLEDNRPMETDRWSVLGFLEALIVGILRGPTLLISVIERVKELMQSSSLSPNDMDKLGQENEPYILKMPDETSDDGKKDGRDGDEGQSNQERLDSFQ